MHSDLRLYVRATLAVSIAVGIAGLLGLLHGLGVLAESGVRWAFIVFGAASMFSAYLGAVVVPRWYSRSTQIVGSVTPERVRLRLEIESDSDSTSLYGTILDRIEPQSRTLLLMPLWSVAPLTESPIEVALYVDPSSRAPVAFGTSKGLLWCTPRWQSIA